MLVCLPNLQAADALVQVTFIDQSNSPATQTHSGRIVVEAQDGGILFQTCDGQLWNITPDRLQGTQATEDLFEPFTPAELADQLQGEFGAGFETLTTRHYVICTDAGLPYARWCNALFERLYAGFQTYWKAGPFKLQEPEFPLTAIIFRRQADYAKYATQDVGPELATASGYFAMRTNRMVLFDLTADNSLTRAQTPADINRRLSSRGANVSTVIHEATHQIAFNCGLNTRYADNPVWLTEGMAMFFETPDLRSRSGWRTIGRINANRLQQFRQFAARGRPADSLATLIGSDARFRDPQHVQASYAESWALTYFLIRTRRADYQKYLEQISQKPRLRWDDRETRLQDFYRAFGDDLEALDQDFRRYMGRLKRRR